MRKIPRAEQETIYRWDAEEQIVHVDSANPAFIRKMDKLCAKYPNDYKCVRVDTEYLAKQYTYPAAYIRHGRPPSAARRAAARRNSGLIRSRTRDE